MLAVIVGGYDFVRDYYRELDSPMDGPKMGQKERERVNAERNVLDCCRNPLKYRYPNSRP